MGVLPDLKQWSLSVCVSCLILYCNFRFGIWVHHVGCVASISVVNECTYFVSCLSNDLVVYGSITLYSDLRVLICFLLVL